MIIGITGKSGAGKTTITKTISKIGFATIELDEVIHYVMDQHKDRTVEIFGPDILQADGTINRIALGDKVFSMRSQYKEYTDFIYRETLEVIDPYLNLNAIVDHILLPHMNVLWDRCDTKILVKADDIVRQERVLARDNISSDYFNLRESASIEYNEDDFDIVINNNKSKNWENFFGD